MLDEKLRQQLEQILIEQKQKRIQTLAQTLKSKKYTLDEVSQALKEYERSQKGN